MKFKVGDIVRLKRDTPFVIKILRFYKNNLNDNMFDYIVIFDYDNLYKKNEECFSGEIFLDNFELDKETVWNNELKEVINGT